MNLDLRSNGFWSMRQVLEELEKAPVGMPPVPATKLPEHEDPIEFEWDARTLEAA